MPADLLAANPATVTVRQPCTKSDPEPVFTRRRQACAIAPGATNLSDAETLLAHQTAVAGYGRNGAKLELRRVRQLACG
ncbi:hypothetical protein [Kitasatospora sp. NPDC088346]|uniref:hypothetical protein n=1 Tax=Kitasatospora sp. NPDC088346 TaxID=3364073 RepID=UPI003810EBB0